MASSGPYQPAASLLNDIWEKRVSLKTLVYNKKGTLSCSKSTYAQVCKVLANRAVLDAVLEACPVTGAKNSGLLYVLAYELLLGPNQKIRGGGALKRKLMKKEAVFRAALVDALVQHPNTAVDFPRYVRVNTWRTTTAQVVETIQKMDIAVFVDPHVPDLLVLPPASTKRLQDESSLLQEAHIVLQDKSSCFSALCLAHGFDESPSSKTTATAKDYLDACAAPGNKTSHLAALLANSATQSSSSSSSNKKKEPPKNPTPTTTIYALDRNKSRLESLERRMVELVPSKDQPHVLVVPECKDFLATQPADYATVGAILLDPSCSGSGIFTALDRQTGDDVDDPDSVSRMEHLSNFQITALKHAMSFPSVNRVVYSTCSIHSQENEQVVEQALSHHRDDWMIVPPKCLANWKRRGVEIEGLSKEETSSMIRVDKGDDTNGFFVCCLQRRSGNKAKKRKSTSESLATCDKSDLPVYGGQFSASGSSKKQATESTQATKKSPTAKATKNSPKPKDSASPSASKAKKRPPAKIKDMSDDKHAKKRAKKLDWKQRQQDNKTARLLKKSKQQQSFAAPTEKEGVTKESSP